MKKFSEMTSAEQAKEIEKTWVKFKRDIRVNFILAGIASTIVGIGAGFATIAILQGEWAWGYIVVGLAIVAVAVQAGTQATIEIADKYGVLTWMQGVTTGKETERLLGKINKKETTKKKKIVVK